MFDIQNSPIVKSPKKKPKNRKNLKNYVKNVLSGIAWLLALSHMIISVAIGITYDECPINRNIPVWLIVYGSVGIFPLVVAFIVRHRKDLDLIYQNNKSSMPRGLFIISLIGLSVQMFNFVWLLTGAVWIISVKDIVTCEQVGSPNYCNFKCFYFSFVSILAYFGLLIIFFFTRIVCLNCCQTNSSFENDQPHS